MSSLTCPDPGDLLTVPAECGLAIRADREGRSRRCKTDWCPALWAGRFAASEVLASVVLKSGLRDEVRRMAPAFAIAA